MAPKSSYLLFLLLIAQSFSQTWAAPIWRRSVGNLQPFHGALGGNEAPAITKDGSALPFKVNGGCFPDVQSAVKESCDSQFRQCLKNHNLNECGAQRGACLKGNNTATPDEPKTAASTQNGGSNSTTTTGTEGTPTGNNRTSTFTPVPDVPKTAAATQTGGSNSTTTEGTPTGNNSTSTFTPVPDAPKTAAATQSNSTTIPETNGPRTSAATQAGGANNTAVATDASEENLQKFNGTLGAPCPKVTNDGSDRPFKVEGNANFDTLQNALIRSCDVQFNQCQNVFNAQPNNAQVIKQGDCAAQQTECNESAQNAGTGAPRTAAATESGTGASADPATPTDAPAEPAAKGGQGGIDPATGETLLPLPEETDFCKGAGQASADGTQIKTGFCSSVGQGQVPAVEKMVSTVVLEPANGAELTAGNAITVKVKVQNMATGFFSVADSEYYTQPQSLDDQGNVKGHVHVTIQNMGDGQNPPDANVKAFFKGLNDKAEADGTLSTEVPAGTIVDPGTYRICTLTGTFSHQPVLMPVAQRGSQDDCIRVTVK